MKRAAALTIAVFYLLLSTGGYVCAMHCATAKLIEPKTENCCDHLGGMCHHSDQSDTPKQKNDNCGDKHGSYAVKESLKPSCNFSLPKEAANARLQPSGVYPLSVHPTEINEVAGNTKAPPDISGRDYLIRLSTLLI